MMLFPAVGCFSVDTFAVSGSVASFTAVDAKIEEIKGKNIVCKTSDKVPITAVKEFVGMKLPAAFLINHGVHGYGKFVYDEQTLTSLHSKLNLITDKLDRK